MDRLAPRRHVFPFQTVEGGEQDQSGGVITRPGQDERGAVPEAAQFAALHYEQDARGRIVVESKDSLRKRGLPSPDRAEAILLAFAGGHRVRIGTLETPRHLRPYFAGILDRKF